MAVLSRLFNSKSRQLGRQEFVTFSAWLDWRLAQQCLLLNLVSRSKPELKNWERRAEKIEVRRAHGC
jgi:hypothetical protein